MDMYTKKGSVFITAGRVYHNELQIIRDMNLIQIPLHVSDGDYLVFGEHGVIKEWYPILNGTCIYQYQNIRVISTEADRFQIINGNLNFNDLGERHDFIGDCIHAPYYIFFKDNEDYYTQLV